MPRAAGELKCALQDLVLKKDMTNSSTLTLRITRPSHYSLLKHLLRIVVLVLGWCKAQTALTKPQQLKSLAEADLPSSQEWC
jgi:hypothetical protein